MQIVLEEAQIQGCYLSTGGTIHEYIQYMLVQLIYMFWGLFGVVTNGDGYLSKIYKVIDLRKYSKS